MTGDAKIASLRAGDSLPAGRGRAARRHNARSHRLPRTPALLGSVHTQPTSAEIANMICRGHHARQLLEAGVVACRDLGSVNGYALGLRDAICAGSIPGPLVQACGLAVCATGGYGGAIGLECYGADAMTRGVRQIVKGGRRRRKDHGFRRVNSPGPEPGPCELTETGFRLRSTPRTHGSKVAIHAHGVTAIRRGIWCGVDSVEHGVFASERSWMRCAAAVPISCRRSLHPITPWRRGCVASRTIPTICAANPSSSAIATCSKNIAERGVNIAFGTDAGNTYDPFDKAYYELVLMVEAALRRNRRLLPPPSALRRLWAFPTVWGELAAGKMRRSSAGRMATLSKTSIT